MSEDAYYRFSNPQMLSLPVHPSKVNVKCILSTERMLWCSSPRGQTSVKLHTHTYHVLVDLIKIEMFNFQNAISDLIKNVYLRYFAFWNSRKLKVFTESTLLFGLQWQCGIESIDKLGVLKLWYVPGFLKCSHVVLSYICKDTSKFAVKKRQF